MATPVRSRPKRDRTCREPLAKRCSRLEENLLRNLEIMRQHRLATEHIKEKRKEEATKQIVDLNAKIDLRAPSSSQPQDVHRELDIDSIAEHFTGLEEGLSYREAMIRGHHGVLEHMQAAQRELVKAKGQWCDQQCDQQCESAPSVPMQSHPRVVYDGARWMGPGLQAAAAAKALHDEKISGSLSACDPTADRSSAPGGIETSQFRPLSARPGPSGAPGDSVSSQRPLSARPGSDNGVGGSVSVQRPLSARVGYRASSAPGGSAPLQPPPSARPLSARQGSVGHSQRPTSAATEVGTTSPAGGSRPPSAGSMKTRCRALENNVRKNHELLLSSRNGIDVVVQLRKQRSERTASKTMQDLKEAFGVPVEFA